MQHTAAQGGAGWAPSRVRPWGQRPLERGTARHRSREAAPDGWTEADCQSLVQTGTGIESSSRVSLELHHSSAWAPLCSELQLPSPPAPSRLAPHLLVQRVPVVHLLHAVVRRRVVVKLHQLGEVVVHQFCHHHCRRQAGQVQRRHRWRDMGGHCSPLPLSWLCPLGPASRRPHLRPQSP